MSYVYAGYAVTFGALALYAVRVVARGRALRRVLTLQAPEDARAQERARKPEGHG